MGKIPDRWLDYKPIGGCIPGTRFIAFKAPLSTAVNNRVNPPLRLDCQSLVQTLPALGMVVDLTNSKRYYEPDELIHKGIIHRKIMVPGRVTPKPDLVKEFVDCVNAFLHENQDNSKLIGVHCTHGVNRTGYFICKYMVAELKIQPDEALRLFSNARGHPIERNNYVADIRRTRSSNHYKQQNRNRRSEEEPAAPPITSWRHTFEHTSYDGQDGGMRHLPAHNGCAPPGPQRQRQQPKKPPPYHMDANGWYVMGDNNGDRNGNGNGYGYDNPMARGGGGGGNRNQRMSTSQPPNWNWRDRGFTDSNAFMNQSLRSAVAHQKATITGGDGRQNNWPRTPGNYPAPTAAAPGDQWNEYRYNGGGGGAVRKHTGPLEGDNFGDRRDPRDRHRPMNLYNGPDESSNFASGLAGWRDSQLRPQDSGRSSTTSQHRRGGNRNFF